MEDCQIVTPGICEEMNLIELNSICFDILRTISNIFHLIEWLQLQVHGNSRENVFSMFYCLEPVFWIVGGRQTCAFLRKQSNKIFYLCLYAHLPHNVQSFPLCYCWYQWTDWNSSCFFPSNSLLIVGWWMLLQT